MSLPFVLFQRHSTPSLPFKIHGYKVLIDFTSPPRFFEHSTRIFKDVSLSSILFFGPLPLLCLGRFLEGELPRFRVVYWHSRRQFLPVWISAVRRQPSAICVFSLDPSLTGGRLVIRRAGVQRALRDFLCVCLNDRFLSVSPSPASNMLGLGRNRSVCCAGHAVFLFCADLLSPMRFVDSPDC